MKQKQIISLLLLPALCLSLLSPLPFTVQAATSSVSKQAVMPANDSPLGYDTATGTSKSYDRLYFGTCYDDMETEGAEGKPYEWRILDGKTNIETDGLFLLSMKLYSGVRFTLPREGTENWWLDPHNSWTSSTCAARIWCGEMAKSDKVFTSAEQGAILATNKADETYNSTGTGYFNSTYGRVHTGALNGDKVFFLSAKEFEDSRYALTTSDTDIGSYMLRTGVDGSYTVDDVTINDGLIATMEQIKSKKLLTVLRIYSKQFTGTAYSKELTATEKFFLDSAMDFGFFPSFLPDGAEDTYEYVYNELTARPAMNLDGSKLLYIMKADNTGHTTFGKIADASDNREWKATLLNSDDTAFKDGITLGSVPENNLFDAGTRMMTIDHPALNTLTGDYNTITAALLDKNDKLVCYGSINTDTSAASTEITIPDGLSDGTYTLRINAEQWNGEKRTDLAAQPYEMSITTAGAHEHLVCGNSDYCTDNHTGVFWTPVASTEDMAAMKADGYYFLTGDIAAPETDCVGHLCTNGNTVTGTLKVGTDGLTVCSCKGRDSISDDIETVAVAAGGTYNQYGSFVGDLRAGDNSALNIRRGAWRKLGVTSTSAARAYICQENGVVPLGEGTTLSIYQGDLYKKGSGDLKLPKNCKIHAYTSTLDAADTSNEESEIFLHLGSRITNIHLGRAGSSCTIEEDGTVSTLTMAEGSTITVPNNAKITTVKEVTASSAITIEDGGKMEKAENIKADAAITIEEGGTLGTVENAETGSVINLHRCTAGAVSSDGTLNLYGAVSGATFTVSKPLHICSDLGEKPKKASVIDVMNTDGTPRLTDGVFTNGWNTYMADANPGDYFTVPTSYKITKTAEGELRCEKRYHEPSAHPVCGAACTHSGTHTGVTWEAVTEWGGDGLALSNSTYYLENDVKRSASGSKITITGNVNICLNGYTLDLNGSHFEVESGAVLNVCDCTGTGKVTNGSGTKGCAVYLPQGGTFNLYGGELSGNTADTPESKGGAVYVNGGTFTMDGGTISQTVPVEVNAGTFNFKGGSLSGHQYSGSAIYQTGGAVSMTGGTISGSSPLSLSGGTFTMTGGSMTTNNEISVSGGTFNINGGSIASARYALVLNSGIVNMTAGRLAGRTSAKITGGTFNMSGGTIDPKKTSQGNWYGVLLQGGTFNMSGGEIRDWPLGCGVEVSSGTTFKVSGTAKITDNTYSGSYGYKAARNVYLKSGAKMTVDTMSEGAAIGVTMENKSGVFSTGGKDCSAYFTSDDTDYTVEADGNNLKLSGTEIQPVVNKILVDGVEAKKNDDGDYFLTLNLGESVTLSAELTPADTEFRWDHNVQFCAKLTSDGVMTGVEKSSVYSNGQPEYKSLYVIYRDKVLKELKVAVVEPTSYTVTYDMQGHGDQIAPLTAAPNEIMPAPDAPGTKGYTFGGWYKDAACTAEWNFAADKVTSKVALYAKWTAKSYSMTLNTAGGECSEMSVLLTYGEACGTLPTPTRSGYTFNGWYDADGTKLEAETVLNKDYPETPAGHTLTARWTVKPAAAPEVTEGNGLSLTYGYAAGSSIFVTAVPAEGHSISGYQWYTCDADGGNATAIEGAAIAAYAIETGKNAGTYYYYCAVTAKRTDNSETAVKNSGVITVAVEKLTPNVTVNNINRTYSGAALTNADISGSTGGVDGTWSWKNGAPKNVADSTSEAVKWTVIFTPDDTANFTAAEKEVRVTISPILLTITGVTAASRDYAKDDTAVTLQGGTLQGVISGEQVGFTLGKGTMTDAGAGAGKAVTTAIQLTGSAAANYTLAQPTDITVTINRIDPDYTLLTGLTAVYGQTLRDVSLADWSGWAWKNEAESVGTVGQKTFSAVFTPSDTANYNTVTKDVTITVSPADYTGAKTAAASAMYGNPGTVALNDYIAEGGTVRYTSAADNDRVLSDVPSVSGQTLHFAFADTEENAGKTAAVTLTVSSASYKDYEITVTLTVLDKNTPNVTVDDINRTYSAAALTNADISGSSGGVDGTWSWKNGAPRNVADSTANGKVWRVVFTPADTTKYKAVEKEVKVTIQAADITVSAGSYKVSKTYDGTAAAGTGSGNADISGRLGDDDVSLTLTPVDYSDANVGGQTKMEVLLTPDGNDKGNYRFNNGAATISVPCEITRATLTVSGTASAAAPYGTMVKDIPISGLTVTLGSTPVVGVWSFGDSEDSETVPNADDTTVRTAVFTPNTGADNYNPLTMDITPTITKIDPVLPTGLAGYAGNRLSTVTLPDDWSWDNGEIALSTDQSSYAASYAGTTNYSAKSGIQLTVTVSEKAQQALSVSMEGWTHGETEETPKYTPAAADGTAVAITYKGRGSTTYAESSTVPADTGDYTVTVTYETMSEIWSGSADFSITRPAHSETVRYTVKFDTGGGKIITSQTVIKNNRATEPKTPAKDGFIFDGWYTDSQCTARYNFNTQVTGNITLYAKWTAEETEKPGENPKEEQEEQKEDEQKPQADNWKNPFTDVTESDWFFDGVKYISENGLMSGMDDTEFAPNLTLTRGMLVTVLYRLSGETAVNKGIPFADVTAGSYYADAVSWAQQNKIILGISETEFAPDENITREQIAVILYRFAEFMGYDISAGADISAYADYNEITGYALSAMRYAVGSGLMKGKTETTLNPKDNATRAEIAAILGRFIKGNR